MKKGRLILGAFMASMLFGTVACDNKPNNNQNQVQTYTVTFNTNGGTTIASKEVNSGEKVGTVTNPTKSNDEHYSYQFEGWYSNEGLTTKFDLATSTVTSNVTLYAKWTAIPNKHTITFNTNGGEALNPINGNYGETLELPTPTKANNVEIGYKFEGWFSDESLQTKFDEKSKVTGDMVLYAKWSEKTAEYKVSFDMNGAKAIDDTLVEYDKNITEPTYEVKKALVGKYDVYYKIEGWYIDDTKIDLDTYKVVSDVTLKAMWVEDYKLVNEAYDEVTYTVIADDYTAGAISHEKSGYYDINGTVRGRTKDWTNPEDKNDKKDWSRSFKDSVITVTAPGDGVMYMYVQNGSSSAATATVRVQPEHSEEIRLTFSGTQAVAPYPAGSPVVRVAFEVKEGEKYTIRSGGGTVDWYQLDMVCAVNKGTVSGFKVSKAGLVDYVIGQSYDPSSMQLQLLYDNGRIDKLAYDAENVTIDSSTFDSSHEGTTSVKVKYGDYEYQTVDIKVWTVESFELGFNSTYIGEHTSAGNTTYINGKTKKIYALNDTLDTKYINLLATAKFGNDNKEFLIKGTENLVTYSALDTTTVGEKTVTVTYNQPNPVTNSYKVTVVDDSPVKNTNNKYIVYVDASYTGVAGAPDATKGNQFATIGEALEFLGRSNVEADTRKIMTVAAGTYREKLEINIPNLTIKGATGNKGDVLIEWNSLSSIPDEGGFAQVTDSCQSVSVREAAINCIMEDITISNYWNSEARFMDSKNLEILTKYGIYVSGKVNDHRALALLVMSDKFTMKNCSLLGYQDTVEFFKGRQYIDHCYIAGATDFIFGTNNTTLFNECEIHTIYNGTTGGGYTTAFKGCSSGASDYVEYGAIFYKCRFTADSQVTASDTALGRTWGPYSRVAFIECNMGAHISKVASSGASQKERYVAMNNTRPTDSTVRYVEYDNEGAGAIYQTQAGMKMLTSAEASKYHTISIIFGTENGMVRYQSAWDPTK